MAYFGTQGGGIAEMHDDIVVWRKPPDWLTEALKGDPIPEDWGYCRSVRRRNQRAFRP